MNKPVKKVKIGTEWIDLSTVNLEKIAKLAIQFSGKEPTKEKIKEFVKEFQNGST